MSYNHITNFHNHDQLMSAIEIEIGHTVSGYIKSIFATIQVLKRPGLGLGTWFSKVISMERIKNVNHNR